MAKIPDKLRCDSSCIIKWSVVYTMLEVPPVVMATAYMSRVSLKLKWKKKFFLVSSYGLGTFLYGSPNSINLVLGWSCHEHSNTAHLW